MKDTLFYHGITTDNKRFTIASYFIHNKKGGIIQGRFGISLCNNNDNFVKKVGRDKAEGRLLSNSDRGNIRISFNPALFTRDIETLIHVGTNLEKDDSRFLKDTYNLNNR